MRVTERQVFEGAAARTGAARARAERAVEEAASGLRVVHPGDDPLAAGQVVGHKLGITRLESLERETGRAADELLAVDAALDGVGSALSRARELAVQMSNDTYNAAQRGLAGEEVGSLMRHAVGLLNTRVGDRYLFGGLADASPPFDAAGNYLGDTGVRQLQLAPGVLQDVSVRADVALKGVGGGSDVLATLQQLATALAANDAAGVRASLDGLDAGVEQVALARERAGASMSVLDAARLSARGARDVEMSGLSNAQEVDLIEAASRVALTQRALDAALSASAKGFQLSLLDRLR